MTDAPPPQNAPEAEPKRPRRHSDKRRRNKITPIRWATEEFNQVAAKANAAGMTFGAFMRALGLGDAGPRAQRTPPIEIKEVTRVLGYVGNQGGLLNQMAKQANIGGFNSASFEEAAEAARQYRDFLYDQMGRQAPPSRTRKGKSAPKSAPKISPPTAPKAAPDSTVATPPSSKFAPRKTGDDTGGEAAG